MKYYIVTLRKNNAIIDILGLFINKYLAEEFVRIEHIEFNKDICQYSKFESDLFIKIEPIELTDH